MLKHRFCPYAKQPYEHNTIGYHVYTGHNILALLEQLALCCIELDNHTEKTLETTVLIIADKQQQYLTDFYDYLDALDVANAFLADPQSFTQYFSPEFQTANEQKQFDSWYNTYQIASFHPNYQFEQTATNARENYTNRSPYPIFHIIRNDAIEEVRSTDKNAENIVKRNIETLNNLSDEAFDELQKLAKPQS